MVRFRYDKDTDPALVQSKKAAIIGFGSQGHALALNLAGNGVGVRVGLPSMNKSREKASARGIRVVSVRNKCVGASLKKMMPFAKPFDVDGEA